MDGIAILDKPRGVTSHDVVARIRRECGIRKVGHAGTLDPSATGVLVLGVGRATRLLGFLAASEKTYEATIRLGSTTESDDADGVMIEQVPRETVHAVTDSDICMAAAQFVGELEQVPSSVSAIKQGGVRAHARVRAGEHVALRPRPVTIRQCDVLGITRNEHVDVQVRVVCSAGTYIRAIARDLGRLLGVGAHVLELRRTASGNFTEPMPVDQFLAQPTFLTMAEAIATVMPVIAVDAAQGEAIRHGRILPWPAGCERGTMGLMDDAGTLLAIVEPRGQELRYCVVLPRSAR